MGIFIVNKPLGLTSFDVVARARKLLNTRRIGHTGTLDPLATGVLVLCTEQSTKLVQFLETDSKDYLAFVSLGANTVTLDAEGPIQEQVDVQPVNEEKIFAVLKNFVGPQQQLPPAYSAIHINGQRAYELARAGKEVQLAPRNITVYAIEFLAQTISMTQAAKQYPQYQFPEPLGNFPTLVLRCSVSSGTYIRSLARDIGLALGTHAHLAGLVRTRVGQFEFTNATELENLAAAVSVNDLTALSYPRIELNAAQAKDVRDGKRLAYTEEGRFALTFQNQLVAIADGDGEYLKVVRAWQ